jgi:dTDP-4-amino-4,6-dideoxygalactose transaminase
LTNWQVPLADLDISHEEIEAVSKVLHSRWLSMGPITTEFEQRFADIVGAKYALAVTNCTAALHIAHLALGAGPGDTVICPSLTFVATANAIRYTGAMPVFADICGPNDFNVSAEAIEACIDTTTKGICVVHYGGYPCDMERIRALAQRYQLYIVEDAAHAPGAAAWVGDSSSGSKILQPCGSIGDIGCFSFFSNKNMTTGEGGMLTTNDPVLADQLRLLRSHGMTSLTWDREQGHSFSYDVVNLGYNYRIDEIRAAIGMVQLGKLAENNQIRGELTNIYRERLADLEDISMPFQSHDGRSSYHLFPIVLPRAELRAPFMEYMKLQGIQTSIHYPPIHKFTNYRCQQHNIGLSKTEDIGNKIVTLPLYAGLKQAHIEYVTATIKAWMLHKSSAR